MQTDERLNEINAAINKLLDAVDRLLVANMSMTQAQEYLQRYGRIQPGSESKQ